MPKIGKEIAMSQENFQKNSGMLFRAHPWHGVPIGDDSPQIVNAYIELVPGDTVKYELDKYSGFLKIDRPQIYSNICPTLYGLIPQTYSGTNVAKFCNERTGREDIVGDKDPLDICVLTEKLVTHGDILVRCRPIGGFRMIDGEEADDKIIAVMNDDAVYNEWSDISFIPQTVINRLQHYFLTYKQPPGTREPRCEITDIYGRGEAYEVIKRGYKDYNEKFKGLSDLANQIHGK